jgi:hypothetical protein
MIEDDPGLLAQIAEGGIASEISQKAQSPV